MAAMSDLKWVRRGLYLITHQLFEAWSWREEPVIDRKTKKQRSEPKTGKLMTRKVNDDTWDLPMDVLIVDEVHRASNVSGWTHKALMNARATYKIGASGTFEGNGFDGAYAVTKWLWPHRAETNIYDWRHKWAETEYDHFAVRNEKTIGEKNPGAFVSSLPCYVMIENGLPEPEMHELWVDLYSDQRRVYDELDKKMVAWINDNPLVTSISITRRIRQRQCTLAMLTPVYDEQDPNLLVDVLFDKDAESVKADAIIELLHKKVKGTALILTDFQKFAALLTHRLNDEFGEGTAAEWSGAVNEKTRAEVKANFIGGNLRIIVGVISAMGTGTDGLQLACQDLIFASRADSRIDNEQGIGRLNRRGQTKQVRVWQFLARDTIDGGQLSNQVQAALAANKRRKKF